ncbi:MAG: hypothetical protein EU544_04780 [Promethearchaeota archaeon]|nr:MAG: hypothetical protein EU544_04780 [Candidatus Lokiarchaeota archaeon]
MKTIPKTVFIGALFLILLSSFLAHAQMTSFPSENSMQFQNIQLDEEKTPELSEGTNLDFLSQVLDAKKAEYDSLGYYEQYFENSLKATYYALSVLDGLGKLSEVDQGAILDYIMRHYNSTRGTFTDSYSLRYLDMNPSKTYFYLSSVLEINCYAVLSLDILNSLGQIDSQKMLDFIWECHQPSTSGFIGRPYSADLASGFKVATIDNTYFAIKVIDLLDDWELYTPEKTAITNYIGSLQADPNSDGGFLCDLDYNLFTLYSTEPNLLSSYFAVKSLELWNALDTMSMTNFHTFLASLYDSNSYSFDFDVYDDGDTNIIGSALGLELSDITGYLGINYNEILNFLMNNLNAEGYWHRSTILQYYELIDTFQVLRSISDLGEASLLTAEQQDAIKDYVMRCYSWGGFSLLSADYMQQELIWSMVNSFCLFDREEDLPRSELYPILRDSFLKQEFGSWDQLSFFKNTHMQPVTYLFRSEPIEYYNQGSHAHIEELGCLNDQFSSYLALDSLKRIYKLDDFHSEVANLNKFVTEVVKAQFLEEGYSNRGGFLPSSVYQLFGTDNQRNEIVYLKHSYGAIKILEIVSEFLNLGEIKDLGIDVSALCAYINSLLNNGHIEAPYVQTLSTAFENTFYAVEIASLLDQLSAINLNAIENFIIQNLDYGNIKQIYYAWKISQIAGLNINFDVYSVHDLIEEVYVSELQEFRAHDSLNKTDPLILGWICEMAQTDKIRIESTYANAVPLGANWDLDVSLCNIILEDFLGSTVVKFESDQLGQTTFSKEGLLYSTSLYVSPEASNYPTIEGYIRIYDGLTVTSEEYVSSQTSYQLDYETEIIETDGYLYITAFISRIFFSGPQPLSNSKITVEIYKDGSFFEDIELEATDYVDSTLFEGGYELKNSGEYDVKVILEDSFAGTSLTLQEQEYSLGSEEESPNEDEDEISEDELQMGISLSLMIGGVSCVPMILLAKTKMNSRKRLRLE